MTQPIVLYDIPGNDPQTLRWSPNSWKTRISLAYKGLPYKSAWVELPDIEPTCKKLGVPHTQLSPSGESTYTVPFIYDPNTDRHVVESAAIAKYLDETYPDTPKLFPPGTDAFQHAFLNLAWPSIGLPLYFSGMLGCLRVLNPASQPFWRKSREGMFGKPLEEMATEESWNSFVAGLGKLKAALEANGSTGGFFMGETLTFADLQIAASLLWIKVVDGEVWDSIAGLHDGTWKNYLERFSGYISARESV